MRKETKLVMKVAAAKGRIAGLTQTEIGKRLGIKQSAVSELLRDNPYVAPPTLDLDLPKGVDRADITERSDLLLEGGETKEILRSLSPYGKKMEIEIFGGKRVTPTGSRGFDRRATHLISDRIDRSSTVGVAWDMGIRPFDTTIPGFVQRDYLKEEKAIRFLPLCGITSNSQESLIKSSTVIAMRYHRLINRNFPVDVPQLLNLNFMPLVHPQTRVRKTYPKGGKPDSSDVVSYLSTAFPDYRIIFGNMDGTETTPAPLVDKVDMILTGIGNNKTEGKKLLDLLYPGRNALVPGIELEGQQLTKKRLLEEIVVGDLAGVLLPDTAGKHAARNKRITDTLNDRLATLRAEHLLNCCQRASDSRRKPRPPGVVLIAHGELSYRPVMAAVELGLVSCLIIDHRLSSEIKRRAKPCQPAKPAGPKNRGL